METSPEKEFLAGEKIPRRWKNSPPGEKIPRRWKRLATLLVFNRGTEEKVRQATASCHLFDIAGPLAADPHL